MPKDGIDIFDVMRWSQEAERSRRKQNRRRRRGRLHAEAEHNPCGDSGVSPQESEQLDLLDPSGNTVDVESVHEPGAA